MPARKRVQTIQLHSSKGMRIYSSGSALDLRSASTTIFNATIGWTNIDRSECFVWCGCDVQFDGWLDARHKL
jgi:hypothetical protein